MKKEIHVLVSGRVQLVMYRDFSQRKARALGIVGTVQNLKNGTVEIFAEGEQGVLEQYIEKLKKGSLLSRVDEVQVEWREAVGMFEDFDILF